MVRTQIVSRGIHDRRVLEAMVEVERRRFVPHDLRARALADCALPIGHGATISQPYVVALMTQLARLEPGDRALEVGTGSGYQAAILAELGVEVFSVERVEALHERGRVIFEELGIAARLKPRAASSATEFGQVWTRHADGFAGWPERAPFDAIFVTAAPLELPDRLLDQLAIGGRLVAPVGPRWCQSLRVFERTEDDILERHETDVTFVPMLPGLC